MSVQVVVDSSACLPEQVAREWGISVLDLHVTGATTAGLNALELCAAYARLMERGGDAGVIALHVPKELSQTWSAAVQAAAVVGPQVRVVDTPTLGAGVAHAAIAAARCAREGGDLEACYAAAAEVLENAATWLYVHRIDELRRSGRLSAATAMMSAALATKPIMRVAGGKVELATKTRTQAKAFAKLSDAVHDFVDEKPGLVVLQEYEARESAHRLCDMLLPGCAAGTAVITVPLSEAMAAHTGPGAVGVSVLPGASAKDWSGVPVVHAPVSYPQAQESEPEE